MRKRVSRKSAASEAIFTCDALKSMCGKHTTLFKTNGSLDRHAMYMTRNGVRICVVLREWELPKGNWQPAAHIGRYKVYFHKNQLT